MSVGSTRFDRRVLLKRGALAAGAAAAVALVPGPLAGVLGSGDGEGDRISAAGDDPTGLEPMVAYVRDAAAGEVVLMAGAEQIVVTDRVLVARLGRAQRALQAGLS